MVISCAHVLKQRKIIKRVKATANFTCSLNRMLTYEQTIWMCVCNETQTGTGYQYIPRKIVMGSMLKPRQIEHKPILTRGDPSLRKDYKSDPTLW